MRVTANSPAHLHVRGAFLSLLLLLMLSACATPPQTRALLQSADTLPRHIELTQTPFFPQQRYQCGPAALATVLVQAGVDTHADALVDQVYLPGRKGSLQAELIGATRRHQRVPYVLAPSIQALLRELAAGNPVLVLQNLGLSGLPAWHYAVAIGYDLDTQILLLRSGTQARRSTDLGKFERTWQRSGYWALVITPPGQLPATANAQTYLTAVAELERMRAFSAAAHAYATALERWPDNDIAALGLANSLYAQQQLPEASAALQTALQRHPQHAVLHNNLAQVLAERGELAAALLHARRAVALGGPHKAQFAETLAGIEARLRKP